MAKRWTWPVLTAWTLAFGLGMHPVLTHATEAGSATKATTATTPAHRPKKAKAPKPRFDNSHSETRAEREKRLLRECRGKPNSGACEGYGG